MTDEQPPKPERRQTGILEGSLAQALGGALASTLVLSLASAKIYLAAGLESSLGTLFSVLGYICWRSLRRK